MSTPSDTARPATLDCCDFHAAGGAMGQACSDQPDTEDLFANLDSFVPERTSPRYPRPGDMETDKATLAAERRNASAPFRSYHSTCRVCGTAKSRGQVRVGLTPNPMRCPKCEPVAYAREHGTHTPSPADFLDMRKAGQVSMDAPSVCELTILCALHVAGGSSKLSSLQAGHRLTKRTLGGLLANRWCGKSRAPGEPVLVLTDRGRAVMHAGLTLCLTHPTPNN